MMRIDKVVIQIENEKDKLKARDKVTIIYTDWLYNLHQVSDGY